MNLNMRVEINDLKTNEFKKEKINILSLTKLFIKYIFPVKIAHKG
jgi:hypothetical protein